VFCAVYILPDAPWGICCFWTTGSGKTRTVEAAARDLFGDSRLNQVDCAEFQHSHEIAKLIGCRQDIWGTVNAPAYTQEALPQATAIT